MKFKTDLCEKLQPPFNTQFTLGIDKPPESQEVYFMSKWREIYERYYMARTFLSKVDENEKFSIFWFGEEYEQENDNKQKSKDILLKSYMFETALINYNIIVDLSWTMTYVSSEYVLYKADQNGNIVDIKELEDMYTIEKAFDFLRKSENEVSSPYKDGNPFEYLKKMCPKFANAIDLIIEFWKNFSESNIRNVYNYIKHKGVPHYEEFDKLTGKARIKYYKGYPGKEKEACPVDTRDVRKTLSLQKMIKELKDFDEEILYPYLVKLIKELTGAVNPSKWIL